ncbi:hypothetical protein BsWGS_22865 [Bradybaena similaris]
MCVNGIQIIPH